MMQPMTKDGAKFGKELRQSDFLLDKGFVNMNHGSFGTYPRVVRDVMRSYQDRAEGQPDKFIRYEFPTLLDESREAMAELLNTPSSTLVFLPNATTGINTVLRNITFCPGDNIVYFSSIYGACEKTVAYITETTPASSVCIPITFPVEDEWLVSEFENTVKEVENRGGKVVIAIFDTVVSMPGVRMPFEDLTRKCKELGVWSCIDGAHGVGHVKLDLGTLDPDFFVSNCHKWLHVPRGTAIFHVPPRNQPLIRSTLPTSHGFLPKPPSAIASPLPLSANTSAFVNNFQFVGTIDNAPYLCVPAALAYREALGGEDVIRAYCFELARVGGALVAQKLGTEVLDNSTHTLTECCMVNVRLPISLPGILKTAAINNIEEGEVGARVRDWMSKTLLDEYSTFVQSLFYKGSWWARLSAQVYLEMEDFERTAGVLGEVCGRVEGGEWVAGGKGRGGSCDGVVRNADGKS